MTRTIEVDEGNFAKTIERGIVLLDFWAGWCGPCRAFAPTYEAAAKRHPDVVFGKIDTEAQGGLASAFGIRSIPTVMALRDGVVVFQQAGALPGGALDELVAAVRGLNMEEVRREIETGAQVRS